MQTDLTFVDPKLLREMQLGLRRRTPPPRPPSPPPPQRQPTTGKRPAATGKRVATRPARSTPAKRGKAAGGSSSSLGGSSSSQLARLIQSGAEVVFVTGSGLSAPSGIPTFRGAANSCWANYVLEWGAPGWG